MVHKACKAAGSDVTEACHDKVQPLNLHKYTHPEVGGHTVCRQSAAMSPLKAGTVATQTWTKLHTQMIPLVYEHCFCMNFT